MDMQMTNDQIRDAVQSGKLVFETMGLEGDVKNMWDPAVAVEIAEARAQFERLTKEQKYRAYRVEANGDRGEPMPTFEAGAGRVIFVPAMAGG